MNEKQLKKIILEEIKNMLSEDVPYNTDIDFETRQKLQKTKDWSSVDPNIIDPPTFKAKCMAQIKKYAQNEAALQSKLNPGKNAWVKICKSAKNKGKSSYELQDYDFGKNVYRSGVDPKCREFAQTTEDVLKIMNVDCSMILSSPFGN